jgi:hypothetical protein
MRVPDDSFNHRSPTLHQSKTMAIERELLDRAESIQQRLLQLRDSL